MAETEKLDPATAGSLPLPDLAEVNSWIGFSLEDIEGTGVGKVSGCFVDGEGGKPAWLLAKLGRFSGEVAIPLHDCAGVAGKVWVPYHRDILRDAPIVDPARPLNREQELVICEYFGMAADQGRAGQVNGRAEGAITSQAPRA